MFATTFRLLALSITLGSILSVTIESTPSTSLTCSRSSSAGGDAGVSLTLVTRPLDSKTSSASRGTSLLVT